LSPGDVSRFTQAGLPWGSFSDDLRAPSRGIACADFFSPWEFGRPAGSAAWGFFRFSGFSDGRAGNRRAGVFPSNEIFSPAAPDGATIFLLLDFFGMGTGASEAYVGPYDKNWEPYVHAALITAAVAIIVALIVGCPTSAPMRQI
jgi:hypothetical protein